MDRPGTADVVEAVLKRRLVGRSFRGPLKTPAAAPAVEGVGSQRLATGGLKGGPSGACALSASALSLFAQGGGSLRSSFRALTPKAWLAARAGF